MTLYDDYRDFETFEDKLDRFVNTIKYERARLLKEEIFCKELLEFKEKQRQSQIDQKNKIIKELKDQINKMRNCNNCKNLHNNQIAHCEDFGNRSQWKYRG